jgi:rhodanese-related sulfurtransferase
VAKAAADRVAKRYGVKFTDKDSVAPWRRDNSRTTYLLDVRSPEEFATGHLPGSRSSPGGQLVQATDTYVGARGARLVLIDDTGVRATLTASWLIQMGWEHVWVLKDGLSGASLERGPWLPTVLGLGDATPAQVEVQELAQEMKRQASVVVDLANSLEYKAGHIPEAWFAIRSRFDKSLPNLPKGLPVVLTSPDGVLAGLAAADASAVLGEPVRTLRGGTRAWKAAGLPLKTGTEHLADAPDDVFLRPYDRAHGQEAAMKEYLSWEVDLVADIKRDGDATFRIPTAR